MSLLARYWKWRNRHRHQWRYHPRTREGWGIARCDCGESDIY